MYRTDKTYEKHSKKLASNSRHDQMEKALSTKASQLALKTSELDDIQKDPCWAEDPDLKARVEVLTEVMQKIEKYISSVQHSLDRSKLINQKMEERRDLLLAGREALLESV